MKKSLVLPTVIIKQEDREPLLNWQRQHGVPIHIWHAFFDRAFGLSFDRAEELIGNGTVAATRQTFQAPGGATTAKELFKIPYQFAYPVGETKKEPTLVADHIEDKNGHILPYVRFEGGRMDLDAGAVKLLTQVSRGTATR